MERDKGVVAVEAERRYAGLLFQQGLIRMTAIRSVEYTPVIAKIFNVGVPVPGIDGFQPRFVPGTALPQCRASPTGS